MTAFTDSDYAKNAWGHSPIQFSVLPSCSLTMYLENMLHSLNTTFTEMGLVTNQKSMTTQKYVTSHLH